MDDIVWLQPNSTYATVSASLALAGGRRVALVFPTGEHTCLHDTSLLNALATRCRLLGKEAVLIGGDAWLRAHAVATGFETATSLEDWGETAPELYAPRTRRTNTTNTSAPPASHLWVVAPRMADGARGEDSGEHDTWVGEPPEYVIELRRVYADQSPVVRRPVVTPAQHVDMTITRDDDALAASERFEEMVVGRILETSGLHRPAAPGAI